MRAKGWFIQRIESGTTGKGIPDIYAVSPTGVALWLELKRVHHNKGFEEVIPWRPGQQAWLNGITRRKQLAYTLVAFNDCIVQIPHDRVYAEDRVSFIEGMYTTGTFRSIKELLG